MDICPGYVRMCKKRHSQSMQVATSLSWVDKRFHYDLDKTALAVLIWEVPKYPLLHVLRGVIVVLGILTTVLMSAYTLLVSACSNYLLR